MRLPIKVKQAAKRSTHYNEEWDSYCFLLSNGQTIEIGPADRADPEWLIAFLRRLGAANLSIKLG